MLAGRVGAQSSTSWPCDTCSTCWSFDDGDCMSQLNEAWMCVGSSYRWCGPNPCDSCSGCVTYGGTCDTNILDQASCIGNGGYNQWCGAAEICAGCECCFTLSDTLGPNCDLGCYGADHCPLHGYVDGKYWIWCPDWEPCFGGAQGQPCCWKWEAQNGYNGFCDYGLNSESDCLAWAGTDNLRFAQWCGSYIHPGSPTVSPSSLSGDVCANSGCQHCYRDGMCDMGIVTESDCLSDPSWVGQWCGSGGSDCKDSTGQLCTTCLTPFGCDAVYSTSSGCNGFGQ